MHIHKEQREKTVLTSLSHSHLCAKVHLGFQVFHSLISPQHSQAKESPKISAQSWQSCQCSCKSQRLYLKAFVRILSQVCSSVKVYYQTLTEASSSCVLVSPYACNFPMDQSPISLQSKLITCSTKKLCCILLKVTMVVRCSFS